MKKLLFLILTGFSLNQFAQQLNNWDSVVVNGFGSNEEITQLCTYNGTIYAGTASTSTMTPIIYKSTTGDMNDWAPTNFGSFALPGDKSVTVLSNDISTGGKMFVGVKNMSNGASVYTYDGSTWNVLSGSTPPWGSTYNTIQKIFFYSNGGGADSVFVIIGNDVNSVPWKIWKSGKNTSSWSQVLTLPSNVTSVNDAIVFNDSIFFTTYDWSMMESYIYKCTNGSDTVRTHTNPGITTYDNEVRSFGIFRNTLYAGTFNYFNGASFFTYSSAGTWNTITADGFGHPNDLVEIGNIHVFRDKLWIECTVQMGSFPQNRIIGRPHTVLGGPNSPIVFRSDDGINFTQSSPSGFYDYNNQGSTWKLTHLDNYLYCGGINNNVGGFIYRVLVPDANFSGDIGTNVCVGNTETFTNTSQAASSYKWYVNGSLFSTSTNMTYSYSTAGSYTISLVAYSSDLSLSDSTVVTRNVSNVPILGNPSSPTICIGETIDVFTTISATNLPYNVFWNDGIDSYVTDTFQYTGAATTTFTLVVTDALGCSNSNAHPIYVNGNTNINGHVTTPLGADVNNGYVYAIAHQPGTAALDTIDITALNSSGNYTFNNLPARDYLVKAIADPITFPTAVPTYYGNTFQWDSSTVVTHGCSINETANIQILETDTSTGHGIISGYISEGPGFGTLRLGPGIGNPNIPFAPGGPLKGIDVKLGKNPGGGIQARTMSDSTGYYKFDSLPDGGYKIYVDIPNLPMDSTREVIINGSDSSLQNNYFADSIHIYINPDAVVGIYASTKEYDNKFSIYPNPAKDNLYIKLELNEISDIQIDLMSALGQSIQTAQVKNVTGKVEHPIDISSLKPGIYFISVTNKSKKYTQRLIVVN
ncbi:MAG TPA: T9SS type A sorting domain-containing protein [Bacteroidia bacterium]